MHITVYMCSERQLSAVAGADGVGGGGPQAESTPRRAARRPAAMHELPAGSAGRGESARAETRACRGGVNHLLTYLLPPVN